MKIDFKKSFTRDLGKLKDKSLKKRVADAINQVEKAEVLTDVKPLERLKDGESYFRIRVGNYRIGLRLDDETIVFVRFLHRKDIYRYFP